jgi:hypothetical protein
MRNFDQLDESDIMSKGELSTPHQFHHDSGKDVSIDHEYVSTEYIAHMSKKLAELAFNARLESLHYILLKVQSAPDSFDLDNQFQVYGRTDASNNSVLSIG